MDQSGAGDHDVTISVKSTVTGLTRTAKSGSDGTYRIVFLVMNDMKSLPICGGFTEKPVYLRFSLQGKRQWIFS